ncbi:MAG: Type 1 glutamine amidotransferase-like domain-containing protein [Planctomycetes bacterium]|nr:Type 1 glutamine amidotransferase-like domain-containing protein [Planctomycetota bacterium]
MTTSVTILGPQRHDPIIRGVLEEHGIEGQLAVITGGWEEREDEVDDLEEHLGRPTLNLQLHERFQGVLSRETRFSQALLDRNDRLRIAQTLYRRRLRGALESVRNLYGLTIPRMDLLTAERVDALRAVSDLDHHYLTQIRGIHQAFQDLWDPTLNPSIGETRSQLKAELSDCAGVLIAGGNVGVLLDQLQLLRMRPLLANIPIVAWSAGAMVITDRIVLFHDSPPQGKGDPEIYDDGLRIAPRIVALPHAKHRLRLNDEHRVGILAGRFAPATCVALDEGCGVHWDGLEWTPIGGSRRLAPDGQVIEMVSE